MAETTTAETVTTEWAQEFGQRWLQAWNSHQPERVLELMTEDVVYDDSAWPQTMRGHAQVREFVDSLWRAFPDLTFEVVDGPLIASDGPRAAFWWRGRATHTGSLDPPGLPATGKPVEVEGAALEEYRDGKVARLRIVVDMADVSRQLGAMPQRGSAAEKAMVGVQQVIAKVRERL